MGEPPQPGPPIYAFGGGEDAGFAVLDDSRGRLEAAIRELGDRLKDRWRVIVTAAGLA